MKTPSSSATEQEDNSTGLGLAARIAARAANVRPNEAGTAVLASVVAEDRATSPRLVTREHGGKVLIPPIIKTARQSTKALLVGTGKQVAMLRRL